MDYNKLRTPFLTLTSEEQLALVIAVRNSRLTVKEKVRKKKTGKSSSKLQKAFTLLQGLSEEDKQMLLEEFGGVENA